MSFEAVWSSPYTPILFWGIFGSLAFLCLLFLSRVKSLRSLETSAQPASFNSGHFVASLLALIVATVLLILVPIVAATGMAQTRSGALVLGLFGCGILLLVAVYSRRRGNLRWLRVDSH